MTQQPRRQAPAASPGEGVPSLCSQVNQLQWSLEEAVLSEMLSYL